MNAFLIVSEIFIGIQMLLLLLGLPFAKEPFSIRMEFKNLEILFQLLGVVCFRMFVLLRMPYKTISYIRIEHNAVFIELFTSCFYPCAKLATNIIVCNPHLLGN